jgi:FixJ family two-component response regulator
MDTVLSGRYASYWEPPHRILCVDDNHDVTDSTAVMLRVMWFEARACYSGPAALLAADEFFRACASSI